MSTPSISAICITYGRVHHLEEAIAAFQAQDIESSAEMIVWNTCPQQKLGLPPYGVRLSFVHWYNLGSRPGSLGEARNLAVGHASGDVIVILDDDDIPLKGHLRFYADAFAANPGCDWILNEQQFYMEGDQIKAITPGAQHMFAFTKRAWKAVGGYPALTCGEDRKLVSAITERFQGKKISPPEPTFIYRWAQGTYHASGMGDDKPGQKTAHERIAADLNERIRTGLEPTGAITLQPKLKMDYEKLAADFMLRQRGEVVKRDATCIVLGGRMGDVVNALPIARYLHLRGETPYWMISWEFRQILDGVSYVKPYPVRLEWTQLNEMLDLAHQRFTRVINCQIFGRNYSPTRKTEAFNRESWMVSGYMRHFRDKSWPLVFDRRDPDRERALCERVFRTDKAKIVCNLTSATSAPLPSGAKVLAQLQHQLPQFEVVDIGALRCLFPFDLVGIMDHPGVRFIVSIDTFTLHAAAACRAPLVAIVRDGWEGTDPRFNCLARLRYSEVERTPQVVLDAILQRPTQARSVSPLVFHHSGDQGDIIYGLCAIRAAGGGRFYISPDAAPMGVRVPPTPETVANIAPLLAVQSYISNTDFWMAKIPPSVNRDLNRFRLNYKGRTNLAKQQLDAFNLTWPEDKPWLDVDRVVQVPGRPICVSRSERYRAPNFPWANLVERWGAKMFFVGTEGEHLDFTASFGSIPHEKTPTLLDLARIIAGAKVCVGNQSCPIAIAHGLGKPVVQECFDFDDNCRFNRPKTIYGNRCRAYIPKEWLL